MEKEAIFGAPSAHNVSQNVSQIVVQNSCSLAGSSLVAESRFPMTTERATNQPSNLLIKSQSSALLKLLSRHALALGSSSLGEFWGSPSPFAWTAVRFSLNLC